MKNIFKIEKAKPAGGRIGKGFVLYGRKSYSTWFERWYPTFEKAIAYCEKRNWAYEVIK